MLRPRSAGEGPASARGALVDSPLAPIEHDLDVRGLAEGA
jgi:hypothetical protein